jgi:DNA-binding MarR family transcriptional regulator
MMDSDLEQDITQLEQIMMQFGWHFSRWLYREISKAGLTMPQYMALRYIFKEDKPVTMTQIAEASHQHGATMTGIIDRLDKQELIIRYRDPNDRRSVMVGITPTGEEIVKTINNQRRLWARKFIENHSTEQRQQILAMWQTVLDSIIEDLEAA